VRPHTGYVYFHLMGEPFLNPHLARFLEMSHEAGLKVNITTNGTLLKQVQPVLLQAPSLRQVNISLGSFEANEMTRPLAAYLTDVTEFVTEASENSGIICAIRLWNMDTDSLKGSNRFNGEILRFLESGMGLSEGHLFERLKEGPSVKLKDRVYLKMAEKFEWPDLEKTDETRELFCHGLRDQVGILVDGTVVPCCLDSEGTIALGNILETPLDDILNSERATALFDGFSRRCAVEPLCQKCGYAKRY
jgi:radical SAM protein with 4Fe4S-binding SPASM domain